MPHPRQTWTLASHPPLNSGPGQERPWAATEGERRVRGEAHQVPRELAVGGSLAGTVTPPCPILLLPLASTADCPFLPQPVTSPQSCIDWNRQVLKRELGLAEDDIIDIPQLFKLMGNTRGWLKAEAFFPNMVRSSKHNLGHRQEELRGAKRPLFRLRSPSGPCWESGLWVQPLYR